MILYRVQISNINADDSWSNEWLPTQATAFAAFNKLVADVGDTNNIHLDEVEVGTRKTSRSSGRANLAAALNLARANREVWPGKLLKRHNGTPREHRPDHATEDLLS